MPTPSRTLWIAAAAVAAVVVAVAAVAVVGPAPAGDDAGGTDAGDDTGADGPTERSENFTNSASPLVTLVEHSVETEILGYPAFGPDGAPIGDATFRVVQGTGNCCENYVTTTPNGRIVDLGGTYPVYSHDDGETWTRVEPVTPFQNGEGALLVAPDGDIVATMWDPYTGDRLVAFKWNAQDGTWTYGETPLKTPFFDRPWMSVLPGPHHGSGLAGEDYATFVRGGVPKEAGYLSYDALTYVRASAPNLETLVPAEAIAAPASYPAEPWADWVQPHTETQVTPLPDGGALATYGFFDLAGQECPVKRTTDDLQWRCFDLAGYEGGRLLVDSEGRLHEVQAGGSEVTYRITPDAGATWTEATVDLPDRYAVEDWDFKVHAGLGDALVALHARDTEAEVDQDMVLRFDVANATAALTHRYMVGDGDLDVGAGVGSDTRFDFTTLGFLPDGRFVVSFTDADHHPPSLAVLVEDVGSIADA